MLINQEQAERAYLQLAELIERMPDLCQPATPESARWMARLYALVSEVGELMDAQTLRSYSAGLPLTRLESAAVESIGFRALEVAGLKAPSGTTAAYVPVGRTFDLLATVGKAIGEARTTLRIVDPYIDGTFLRNFALMANARVRIQLLGTAFSRKSDLPTVAEAWINQHGTDRPLEVRIASVNVLHDRYMFLDGSKTKMVTQSFNKIAARSPALILDLPELPERTAFFEQVWKDAAPLALPC